MLESCRLAAAMPPLSRALARMLGDIAAAAGEQQGHHNVIVASIARMV
jgi:hypothetical protein